MNVSGIITAYVALTKSLSSVAIARNTASDDPVPSGDSTMSSAEKGDTVRAQPDRYGTALSARSETPRTGADPRLGGTIPLVTAPGVTGESDTPLPDAARPHASVPHGSSAPAGYPASRSLIGLRPPAPQQAAAVIIRSDVAATIAGGPQAQTQGNIGMPVRPAITTGDTQHDHDTPPLPSPDVDTAPQSPAAPRRTADTAHHSTVRQTTALPRPADTVSQRGASAEQKAPDSGSGLSLDLDLDLGLDLGSGLNIRRQHSVATPPSDTTEAGAVGMNSDGTDGSLSSPAKAGGLNTPTKASQEGEALPASHEADTTPPPKANEIATPSRAAFLRDNPASGREQTGFEPAPSKGMEQIPDSMKGKSGLTDRPTPLTLNAPSEDAVQETVAPDTVVTPPKREAAMKTPVQEAAHRLPEPDVKTPAQPYQTAATAPAALATPEIDSQPPDHPFVARDAQEPTREGADTHRFRFAGSGIATMASSNETSGGRMRLALPHSVPMTMPGSEQAAAAIGMEAAILNAAMIPGWPAPRPFEIPQRISAQQKQRAAPAQQSEKLNNTPKRDSRDEVAVQTYLANMGVKRSLLARIRAALRPIRQSMKILFGLAVLTTQVVFTLHTVLSELDSIESEKEDLERQPGEQQRRLRG